MFQSNDEDKVWVCTYEDRAFFALLGNDELGSPAMKSKGAFATSNNSLCSFLSHFKQLFLDAMSKALQRYPLDNRGKLVYQSLNLGTASKFKSYISPNVRQYSKYLLLCNCMFSDFAHIELHGWIEC